MSEFPRVLRIRQDFPRPPALPVTDVLKGEMGKFNNAIKPGAKIAVAVGSRGITSIAAIVAGVVAQLKSAGAEPFILPAMGSHGGATPAGQSEVLSSYGITAATMGVPIRDSMAVVQVGTTPGGAPVFCSTEAMQADGIILINRVKPHTDFYGTIGSGLLKMCVIGLGKHAGAAAMHAAASRQGHERVIREMARVVLERAPVLGGVAILENQFHETAQLSVIPRREMASAEEALLAEARRLMPLLPFEEIDLLIVDRIGKNISGAGMDSNVTNRWVHGYLSSLVRGENPAPFIRRIFVRDLTPESHGNAVGIGLADITTTRLVRAMDTRATGVNALTALTPHTAKIPIAFDTDREAIQRALGSLAIDDVRTAKVVRITDTLSLAEMDVSEALWATVNGRPNLVALTPLREMAFGADGNLA